MILQAKDITFYYGKRKKNPVIDNFSLSIETGERVGLFGASGRGKTTLCRLLAGYESPQRGAALLDGRAVAGLRGACPVQMVWQHPETAVDPLLKLRETLDEGGGVQERILKELYIQKAWLDRYPTELSGGELQRICLARALAPTTKFLLCDEMTAMLDLAAQAQIWDFVLRESRRRGIGLLVVSHSRALLEKVCTRIVQF